MLALDKIVPSKTNPRKTFDDASLKELAASITNVGLIEPVIVRPTNGGSKFELVVGERRWKAAKLAGLKEVPAVVRTLDDFQAREIQIIENLQRKDVHPLEEGLGYKALLALKQVGDSKKGATESPIYTMDSIAQRVGKSTSYVYQRLKLADLSEAWQTEFFEHGDRFSAGHAILVARLTDEQQATLKKAWKADYNGVYPSVRALAAHIYERLMRKLDAGAFKKDDATLTSPQALELHPNATPAPDPLTKTNKVFGTLPACTACQFNTAVNRVAYPDTDPKVPTCAHAPCYDAKIEINLLRKQVELRKTSPNAVTVARSSGYGLDSAAKRKLGGVITAEKFTEVKPNAKGAVPALVVEGADRGRVIHIKPSAKEEAAAARRTPPLAERLANLESDIAKQTRIQVLMAIAKAVKLDDTFVRRLAAFCLAEGLDQNERAKLGGERFEKAYSIDEIEKVLTPMPRALWLSSIVGGVYGRQALHGYNNAKALFEAAQHFKVDVKAIEKKVRAEPNFAKRTHDLKAQKRTPAKAKPARSTSDKRAARASAVRSTAVKRSAKHK
jgi:ParB family chromosome partitioning protein